MDMLVVIFFSPSNCKYLICIISFLKERPIQTMKSRSIFKEYGDLKYKIIVILKKHTLIKSAWIHSSRVSDWPN